MFGRSRRQRLREALSAERTPQNPPAPSRLVPLSARPVPREDFVRDLERQGGRLIVPPPTDPGKATS